MNLLVKKFIGSYIYNYYDELVMKISNIFNLPIFFPSLLLFYNNNLRTKSFDGFIYTDASERKNFP